MKLKTPKAKVYAYRTFKVILLSIAIISVVLCFLTNSTAIRTGLILGTTILLTTSFVSSRKFAKEIDSIVLFSKTTGDGYNGFPMTIAMVRACEATFHRDLLRLAIAKLKAEDKCDECNMKGDHGPAGRAADRDSFNATTAFLAYWDMRNRISPVPLQDPDSRIFWTSFEEFLLHARKEMLKDNIHPEAIQRYA
jgi:hypothetical protein